MKRILCLLAFFCGFSGSAHAEPIPNIKSLNLGYSVYVGGLHAMDATAQFTRTGGAYKFGVKTGTQGFLRVLAPWDAELHSNGRLIKTRVQPIEGNVLTYWRDKPNAVHFAFKKKGVEAVFTPPEGDSKHEPVPDKMKHGALDPLSGVIQIISNFAYDKGCDQTVPIYDGHRRFDLTLVDDGTETLDGDGYSVFSGEATRCVINFEMRAGSRKDREGSKFWEDRTAGQAGGKNGRPPVYIYLAKVRDDLPELPVRAETTTPFGGVVVHLNDVSGGKGARLVVE
jgi:hypothetical protein